MNKRKSVKGITLIALIITIVVLLVLAVVAIGAVNNGGIIQHAQDASSDYSEAQEKEQIGLAQNEWAIQKHYPDKGGYNFKSFMISKLKDTEIATDVSGEDDGPLTVIMPSGKYYTVTDEGEIVPVEKGISIAPSELKLTPGSTGTIAVTVTGGADATKTTYAVTEGNAVTVTGTGAQATVTAGTQAGEATITATCEGVTATCKVKVEEEQVAIDITGIYYAFNSDEYNIEITSDNKWVEGKYDNYKYDIEYDENSREINILDEKDEVIANYNVVVINNNKYIVSIQEIRGFDDMNGIHILGSNGISSLIMEDGNFNSRAVGDYESGEYSLNINNRKITYFTYPGSTSTSSDTQNDPIVYNNVLYIASENGDGESIRYIVSRSKW